MSGHVAAIYRHPVKGFTPEALDRVDLLAGENFPNDRIYAVENGPSGYDPVAPAWVTKMKFTVLAAIPAVAAIRTRFHDETQTLSAEAPGRPSFSGRLDEPADAQAFADWLAATLPADDLRGALRVMPSSGAFRFMDHPLGHVSILNLASVRDLSAKMGVELDPLRFRANLYVEGWEPWIENAWAEKSMMVGWAQARVYKPIVRCAATEVDPTTAVRDQEVVKALHDHYGHMLCGIYVHITESGGVGLGDAVTAPE